VKRWLRPSTHIIGGCLEKHMRETGQYADAPILNPNVLALKTAETLADLYAQGKYAISRRGFYEKQSQHDPAEFEEVHCRYRERRSIR
jgi:hypothetical protein